MFLTINQLRYFSSFLLKLNCESFTKAESGMSKSVACKLLYWLAREWNGWLAEIFSNSKRLRLCCVVWKDPSWKLESNTWGRLMTNKLELFHFFSFSALLEFLLNLALMPFSFHFFSSSHFAYKIQFFRCSARKGDLSLLYFVIFTDKKISEAKKKERIARKRSMNLWFRLTPHRPPESARRFTIFFMPSFSSRLSFVSGFSIRLLHHKTNKFQPMMMMVLDVQNECWYFSRK